jgi:hypothetical protein
MSPDILLYNLLDTIFDFVQAPVGTAAFVEVLLAHWHRRSTSR